MPSFLFPAFLVGSVAAAVPLLLHLLRNQQAPEVRFSAIRLLQGVHVEHAARRRIHDPLLLALRVAALCLLAVAFARPYLTRAPGAADDAVTVIAVDRSASMSAEGVWPRAVDVARRVLDEAPRGARVGLVAFDTRADLLVAPTFDRESVRAALERLAPGNGATLFRAAIARAVHALGGRGRLVVVSDLQGNPSDVNSAVPESVHTDIRSALTTWSNVAVTAARKDETGLIATVRNDSTRPGDAAVVAVVDGRQLASQQIHLAAGEVREVAFRGEMANVSVAEVGLAGRDAFAADDRRYLALDNASRTRVLIAGQRGGDEAFYVLAALNAADGAPEFEVQAVRTDHLADRLASWRPDVVALLSPRGLGKAETDAVGAWIRRGGGLFVAVGSDADDTVLAPLVAGLRFSADRSSGDAVSVAAFESRHPLFQQLGPMAEGLSSARFARAWRVDAHGWDVIARFGDGRGAIFERASGRGRVLVLASDLDRGWNDLPLQPSFVPLMQGIGRYLAPDRDRSEFTPETAPATFPHRLGIVQLASGRHAAINLDPRESDPARMTPNAFDAAIRRTRAPSAGEAAGGSVSAEARQSFWRYGLGLMLFALIWEGFLASPTRTRKRRRA